MSCRDGFCPPPDRVSAAAPGRRQPAPERPARREIDPRPKGRQRHERIIERIDKTLAEHGAGPTQDGEPA